jgi:hypothetical protein
MFDGGKRPIKSPPLLPRVPGRPDAGMFVIITRGFAAGLLGQVETVRGGQGHMSNKVPVRLCGPMERVWMINWRRLRQANAEEIGRWGHETYAAHVARVMGGANAVEGR